MDCEIIRHFESKGCCGEVCVLHHKVQNMQCCCIYVSYVPSSRLVNEEVYTEGVFGTLHKAANTTKVRILSA